jgi:hypothetical protein
MTPSEILPRGERPHEDVLDEVYEKYAHGDPFMPIIRFVDHSTLAPEALVGLGLGEHVREWIGHHDVRPYTAPRTGISIETSWQHALGRRECHGDWLEFFERELAAAPVADVVARWVPRFIHAVDAWLFHGLIRTAHAVRALDHRDTPARRGELARGLALGAIGVTRSPIETAPAGAHDVLSFARAGAANLLETTNVPNVHLVTGPMAYAMLSHHLDEATHRAACAAFRRTHADALLVDSSPAVLPVLDDAFFQRLVESRDAHPIKLTEAALRAYTATHDEIFLRAVGRARHLHGIKNVLGFARIARAMLRRAA